MHFNDKRVVWCFNEFHNYYIAQEFILFEHIKLMGVGFTEQYIILTSKLNLNFSLQNSCTPHVLNDIRTANVHNLDLGNLYIYICQDEKCRLMRDLSLSMVFIHFAPLPLSCFFIP